MKLTLSRGPSGPKGTFGILFSSTNEPLCLTLELPWKDNQPDVSCIPEGEYQVSRNQTAKGGFRLHDVPGREGVLIHAGNTIRDILGCILVGKSLGMLHDLPAVLGSADTLKMLIGYLPNEFTLEIVDFV